MKNLTLLLTIFFTANSYAEGPVYHFNFNHAIEEGNQKKSVKNDKVTPLKVEEESKTVSVAKSSKSRFQLRLVGFKNFSSDDIHTANREDYSIEDGDSSFADFKYNDQVLLELLYNPIGNFFLAAGAAYSEFSFGRIVDDGGLGINIDKPRREDALPVFKNNKVKGFSLGLDYRYNLKENIVIPLSARYQLAKKDIRLGETETDAESTWRISNNLEAFDSELELHNILLSTGLSYYHNSLVYEFLVSYNQSKLNIYELEYSDQTLMAG